MKITTDKETGAGIVVGVDREMALIVTALHVVADAKEIHVEFRGNTQKLSARRFDKHHDELDIAVVTVDLPPGKSLLDGLPRFSRGDVETLPLAAEVSIIGHPAGYDWKIAILANKIQELSDPYDSRLFRFTRIGIDRGNSGGPVFDNDGRLLGMVKEKALLDEAAAVKISEIVNLMKVWGLNTNLLSRDKVTPSQVAVPTSNEVPRSSQKASLEDTEEEKLNVRRRTSGVENLQRKFKVDQVCGPEFTSFDEEDLLRQVREELKRGKSEVDEVKVVVAAGYRVAPYSTDPGTTIRAYANFIVCTPQDGEGTCRTPTVDCNNWCSFSYSNARESNKKEALLNIAEFLAEGFRGQRKGGQLPCKR